MVSAEGSDPEQLDQGRQMERGKAKEREGQGLVTEPQGVLQEMAGPCAGEGEHADHVGPWQLAAGGYSGGR